MNRHPCFNLLIHSTEELERLLREPISERRELQSWPLSTVELLTTSSGERLVYKVQREPTVEPEFYAKANTDLLARHEILQRDDSQAAMLLQYLEQPTLESAAPSEEAAVAYGRDLVGRIGSIDNGAPCYADIGTAGRWRSFVHDTLDLLSELITGDVFHDIALSDVDFLRTWAGSDAVLEVVERTSQVIHADLDADHVFVSDKGYIIIDWQRPYRAPGDIDLVTFLESLGISPSPYVDPEVIGLRRFLSLHWAVVAKARLLPELPGYEGWVRDALEKIRNAR